MKTCYYLYDLQIIQKYQQNYKIKKKMRKLLMLSFFILFLTLIDVNCLKVQSDKAVVLQHLSSSISQKLSHRISYAVFNHKQKSSIQIPPTVMAQFMAFALSDSDIMFSMLMGDSLSDSSAQKVKNWFLNNQDLSNSIIQTVQKDKRTPKCFKDLSKDQKKTLVKIVINSMDFKNLMQEKDSSRKLSDNEIKIMREGIQEEKTLGKDVAKCFDSVKGMIQKQE